MVLGNDPTSTENFLLIPDLIATISYYFNLLSKVGVDDDPDSLVNKRIVTIGELLQNQFRIGLLKLEKIQEKESRQKILIRLLLRTLQTINQYLINLNRSLTHQNFLNLWINVILLLKYQTREE